MDQIFNEVGLTIISSIVAQQLQKKRREKTKEGAKWATRTRHKRQGNFTPFVDDNSREGMIERKRKNGNSYSLSLSFLRGFLRLGYFNQPPFLK